MKRIILLLLFFILVHFTFAEECSFMKIKEIKNDKSTFYIRKEVNPYDDNSGNCMFFDKEGNIYGYNIDQSRIFKLDKSFNVIKEAFLDFGPYVVDFSPYEKGFLISFFTGAAFYYDYEFNLKFQAHMQEIAKVEDPNYKAYFDEITDILFFIDEDKNIHSIEHPSLDENLNQKNYRDSSKTMTNLGLGNYAPHLTIDRKKNLFIDGIQYSKGYYDYEFYETKDYIVSLINEDYYINVYDRTKSQYFYYTIPENEKIESITYHPNGDWYFLTINWSTNTHTIWRIENSWDLEWRNQWYKNNQESKTSLLNISSTNVDLEKEMSCNDNLRLRSEEITSSKIITTMKKGTKVKILKLGKAEAIDGINSNWVQVEVLKGGLDKDGNPIKTGTVGWCYGGYLK